ncbi:hypothetical protein [Microbacterium allomyrinae]|uniref:Fibronectin type-III domain-containing protein n=1 Tax=Microbacterium allomyrinae TaxID=2830666 RepID=A0A9X1LWB8_9MICO|nr:hypothetical protein [Microbacterium allomyrinae]MCC2033062.1 hypothetical protein [Microbacterium allomyrinae]
MTFDVRLRLYNDDGTKSRVLKTIRMDVTQADSSACRVTFATSSRVAGSLDAPFLVGVEYTTGGVWASPRNDLFIATEDNSDNAEQSGVVSFTAQDVLSWLTQRLPLWWKSGDNAQDRTYTNVTPGALLNEIITYGKTGGLGDGAGWGPNVTTDFTGTTDSVGAAWAQQVDQTYPLFTTSLSRIIDGLSDQGYIEWWSEGFKLRVVNAGTATDRSNVVFGGRGFTRSPAKSVYEPATAIVIQYDGGWTHAVNPGASNRFGSVFQVMSQSGAPDIPAAQQNAQPALTKARAVSRELSYEWAPVGGMTAPWAGFNIGDLVTARTRGGKILQRVVGIVVTKDVAGVVTARTVVGDKMLTQAAKLARRTSAAQVGQIIGGSGSSVPPTTAPASPDPNAPDALHVVSNTASWGEDGAAVAAVGVAWDQVTDAVDSTAIDVNLYELWAREASETAHMVTATDQLSTTVPGLKSGVPVWVKVRARSVRGRWSEFSPEITVTPASPLSIVPKVPTGLEVTSNTAEFQADGSSVATLRVQWDAVTLSTDDVAVVIDRYELWLLDGAVWGPVSASPSRDVLVSVQSGQARSFKVRAYTTLGVWSDFTSHVDVIAALPDAFDIAPTDPTLTTSLGMVQAQWDGVLTGGVLPAGVQHVLVEHAALTGGPWTRVAVPLPNGGGSSPIRGVVGESMFVRFIPVDTLGREFTPSAVVSIVVTGITGPDLEANSVTANTIAVGAIEVQHLSSGLGSHIDLGENSVIISITAEQESLAGQVDETAGAVGQLTSWFRVDENGAHVGSTGSPFQTHVKPDRFEITDNGVVTSYWEGGRMVVPKLEATEIVLAQHKFEPYADGTVVRALGI